MHRAAEQQRYERAAWLRRRSRRLRSIFSRLGGVVEATHARPRLVLAAHPTARKFDAFWLAGGRLVDWGPLPDDPGELAQRTELARRRAGHAGDLGVHLPPDEVDEVRILASYIASHLGTPQLMLASAPRLQALASFLAAVERELGDLGGDPVRADLHGGAGLDLAADEGEGDRPVPGGDCDGANVASKALAVD
jgi:DNA polymerase III subunit epsilon